MVWRLHDDITLSVTELTKQELIESLTKDDSLKILDKLSPGNYSLDMTFSPQHQIIFDTFNEIVKSEAYYFTTVGKIKAFAIECYVNPTICDLMTNDSQSLNGLIRIVDVFTDEHLLKEWGYSDNLIVVIEFDD
jgi:hypothetical protein